MQLFRLRRHSRRVVRAFLTVAFTLAITTILTGTPVNADQPDQLAHHDFASSSSSIPSIPDASFPPSQSESRSRRPPSLRFERDPYSAGLPERTYEDIIRSALNRYRDGHLRIFERADNDSTVLSKAEVDLKAELARELGFDYDPLPNPPKQYDPRSNSTWRFICPTVMTVRDQGNCDGDWAAAVASAFSDRLCIQTNGTISKHLSVQDILSCCGWRCGMGCNGGYSAKGWNYLQTSGAITGGDYNTTAGTPSGGCLPYSLPPCQFDVTHACDAIPGSTLTPTCSRMCAERYYSHAPERITNTTTAIEAELYYHGPVTSTIDLYQDFLLQAGLRRTIYQHRPGAPVIGSLTIKLLGYGRAEWSATDYWIAATSWGPNWGDYKGFFFIARGTNECNVENGAIGAMVNLEPNGGNS